MLVGFHIAATDFPPMLAAMSGQGTLLGLAAILVLGVASQWIAWRLRLPAILVLLTVGLLVGPGSAWASTLSWWPESWPDRLIDPERLLGDLLIPLVSMAVAVVLFEGGLTLNVSELAEGGTGAVLGKLVSIGAAVTLVLAAAAAHWVVGLNWPIAVLLGAVLVVTGPTVIGPLLRHIRPRGKVGAILKWEGIVIDPIGATLAVLVFEAMTAGALTERASVVATGVLYTVLVGTIVGSVCALLMIFLMRRMFLPDTLHNSVMLMMVIAAATVSNLLQSESGLLTVVVMGVILANQRSVSIAHIAEFKEQLTGLLVAVLFIVLSARIRVEQLTELGWASLAFIILLILVVRPASVLLSTIGSSLNWRERVFLCWMAPRGIVAAAVASLFALRLTRAGVEGATMLLPLTIAVIIGTVTFYGLTARMAARVLGLAKPGAHGFLIAGANPVARAIGACLKQEGFEVLLVDLNYSNVQAARLAGLPAMYASILAQAVRERIEISGIGRLLALTPNDDVNTLAAVHWARWFGRSNVYQLASSRQDEENPKATEEIRGRVLFGEGITYAQLLARLENGAQMRRTPLTREFNYDVVRRHYGNDMLPMFLISEGSELTVFTKANAPTPRPGQVLLHLSSPTPDERAVAPQRPVEAGAVPDAPQA